MHNTFLWHYRFFEKQTNNQENRSHLNDDEDDSEEDSEDDFDIKTGDGWSCNHAAESMVNKMEEEDRSTHFIAIKITVPDIVFKAQEIQRHVVEKEKVWCSWHFKKHIS